MQCYQLNDYNKFNLTIHPWDEEVFGYKVSEVTDLEYDDSGVFQLIDAQNKELGITLSCSRQDSNNLAAKKNFLNNGFYIAEQSLIVAAELRKIKAKRVFNFKIAQPQHLPSLQKIAEQEFLFGRFHEDPFIEIEKAQFRYSRWVKQLVGEGKCLIAEDSSSGKVIGFFHYHMVDQKCNLLLAGINSEYRGYGYFFFSSIFDYLKPQAKTIEATISSANISIVNLYSHFNFKVTNSLFGYHKWYS